MANITCGILIDLSPEDAVILADDKQTSGDLLPILETHEDLLIGPTASTQRGKSETLFNGASYAKISLNRHPGKVQEQVDAIAIGVLSSYNTVHAPRASFEFARMNGTLPKPDCIRYEWIRGDLICRYNYKLKGTPSTIKYNVHLTIAIRDHYTR